MRRFLSAFIGVHLCQLVLFSQTPVTSARLDQALSEPKNWLTYWGDYSAIRHRNLKQITADNVQNLRLDWVYQTGDHRPERHRRRARREIRPPTLAV